jgi:hypothetical protein
MRVYTVCTLLQVATHETPPVRSLGSLSHHALRRLRECISERIFSARFLHHQRSGQHCAAQYCYGHKWDDGAGHVCHFSARGHLFDNRLLWQSGQPLSNEPNGPHRLYSRTVVLQHSRGGDYLSGSFFRRPPFTVTFVRSQTATPCTHPL